MASWTTFHKAEDPDGDFDDWSLGYARHAGRWGVVVRLTTGNRNCPENSDSDTWFFNDAPRFIKTKAVDALPELIEGLVAVADKTADKLLKKVPDATSLAAAVTQHFEKRKK